MRLRYVYTGNFRKNEVTLYEEARGEMGDVAPFRANDCILVINRARKLLRFIYLPQEVSQNPDGKKANGVSIRVMASQVYRILENGTWDPRMLSFYASQLGVELEGIKKFEEYFAHLLEERRERTG